MKENTMKNYLLMLLFASIVPFYFACSNESNSVMPKNRSPYSEQTDTISPEMSDYLDEIPAEDLTEEDMTLENGNNVIEFIQAYDSSFINENPWILEFDNIKSNENNGQEETRSAKRSQSNITGNAGIINLKTAIISEMFSGSAFFLNDPSGIAENKVVREKIADKDQIGLWYKWGGKIWNDYGYPSSGGEPADGEEMECYGLDCSGLVYSAMNRIGFNIESLRANDYYNLNLWNNALHSFLLKKKQFSDEIKNNLKFEKYEYANTEIVSKVQPGDIIFWGPLRGHIGIVSNGGKIAQSNGKQHPEHATDNGTSKRGPHLITVKNASITKYWGALKFGVIRLVATLNNTHWRLNIRCEEKNTYITSFDIEINMKESTKGEIEIAPITTIGHDYGGEPCDVYFTGTFNPETQILKGSVKKTYSTETRTDGFEVKLIDDNIYNIEEYRIVSNGGCTNFLDLENLDNKTPNSARKRVKVNTTYSVLQKGDCADHNVFVY